MVVLSRQPTSLLASGPLHWLVDGGLHLHPRVVRFSDTGELWRRATISHEGQDRYVEIAGDLDRDSCQTVSPPIDVRISAAVNNLSRGAS